MTPLERAIAICGTQSELARRVTGKPATGHVYHWRNNGFSEDIAVAIEAAVRAVVDESAEAAERAVMCGGLVTVEELRPDREWDRDESGAITGYRVPLHRPGAAAEESSAAQPPDDMSEAA
jgi:DNA-binding transcriptional regulator YdaS (Cro superfamily)